MKHLLLFFMLIFSISAFSQPVKSSGIWYFQGAPNISANPPRGVEVAYSIDLKKIYVWDRIDSQWVDVVEINSLDSENVEDIIANLITGSTHNGISVVYDDILGTLSFNVTQIAVDIPIADVAGLITATEVEGALNEAFSNINVLDLRSFNTNQALGVPDFATNMGAYTGSILTDNISAKSNIQEVADSLENLNTIYTSDGSTGNALRTVTNGGGILFSDPNYLGTDYIQLYNNFDMPFELEGVELYQGVLFRDEQGNGLTYALGAADQGFYMYTGANGTLVLNNGIYSNGIFEFSASISSFENPGMSFYSGSGGAFLTDKSSTKKGMRLLGFGESDADDLAGTASYSSLVNTSLTPKGYVDQFGLFNGTTDKQLDEDEFMSIGLKETTADGTEMVFDIIEEDYLAEMYTYNSASTAEAYIATKHQASTPQIFIQARRIGNSTSLNFTDTYTEHRSSGGKAIQLMGFGGSDIDDTANLSDYSTLVNNSTITKGFVYQHGLFKGVTDYQLDNDEFETRGILHQIGDYQYGVGVLSEEIVTEMRTHNSNTKVGTVISSNPLSAVIQSYDAQGEGCYFSVNQLETTFRSTSDRGILYLGFGESDINDIGATAVYDNLPNTSLVPKGYILGLAKSEHFTAVALQSTYTVSSGTISTNSANLVVIVDGLEKTEGAAEYYTYVAATGVITFNTAFVGGEKVKIRWYD